MAGLAQIAHGRRRAGTLDPKVEVTALDYCMYTACMPPGTKASHGAVCSASQEARGHIDAWPR